MNALNGYSSGEDDLQEEVETDTLSPSDIEKVNIFSQNYSNQINMSSCFIYMPWKPSLLTVNKLKKVTNVAIKRLQAERPQQISNYNWKDIRNGNLDYHISLYPNIFGKRHQIESLIQNLTNSISGFKVIPNLVGHDADEIQRMNNLNSLLFSKGSGGGLKYKNYINFDLDSNLHLFKSHTTDNLFLACRIDTSSPDTASFYTSLNNYIVDNLKLLDLPTSNDSLSYHISIQLGELKNLRKMSDDDFQHLNKVLGDLDFSPYLKDINIHVNEVVVYVLNQEKKFVPIPFNISS